MPLHGGRRRPQSNRTKTPREAAHRLWGTPLDPKDDKPPPDKTPSERMSDLLRDNVRKRKEPPQ